MQGTMAAGATQAQAASGNAQLAPSGSAAMALAPFNRAGRRHREGPFFDSGSQLLGANPRVLGPIDVPSYGFLRHIIVLVEATGGTASGTNAVAKEDAPWSILDSIQLTDVNGAPIISLMSGYDLFIANLVGGYAPSDPRSNPAFQTVTVGGNFSFALRIPVEISARDALGALPNQNAASTYKLNMVLREEGAVFSTNPGGTQPSVRIRCFLEAWTQPDPFDLLNNPQAVVPPAVGTTQFWTKQGGNVVSSGANRSRFSRVGNFWRNVVMIFRDSSGSRSGFEASIPDPIQIEWDGRVLLNDAKRVLRTVMAEQSRSIGAQAGQTDSPALTTGAVALPNGVVWYTFADDFDGKMGFELRDLWLPTTQASRVEWVGVAGAAGTVDYLINDVATAGSPYVS